MCVWGGTLAEKQSHSRCVRTMVWPWSCASMEVVFALLDTSHKRNNFCIVNRDSFTKSGEVSNFSRSFTGVPFRNLAEIPRCADDLKANILGDAAVGAFKDEKTRVFREVEAKGHPLFWGEWKPVQLYSCFFTASSERRRS